MARLPVPNRFFARAQQRARRLLQHPDELLDLAKQAEGKARHLESGALAELKALLRLIRAYARGDYRNVPWQSMVIVVGAVVYLVSPLDFLPDFIPVSGFLDDATVLGLALRKVQKEIDAFRAWEEEAGAASEPETG